MFFQNLKISEQISGFQSKLWLKDKIPCSLCSLDIAYSFKCPWLWNIGQLITIVWNKSQRKYKLRKDSYEICSNHFVLEKILKGHSLCEYRALLTKVTELKSKFNLLIASSAIVKKLEFLKQLLKYTPHFCSFLTTTTKSHSHTRRSKRVGGADYEWAVIHPTKNSSSTTEEGGNGY